MSKLSTVFAFVAGGAVGATTAWFFTKKVYERIVDEEIADVKARFTVPKETKSEDENPDEPDPEQPSLSKNVKPNLMDYAARVRNEGYGEPEEDEPAEESPLDRNPVPYVVSPEEFAEMDEYTTVSLTYYADQVLADDDDVVIHDVEDLVGFDSLNHFGEYDDDAVYVRNERLKTDFEILLDHRTYAEVLAKSPYKAEV